MTGAIGPARFLAVGLLALAAAGLTGGLGARWLGLPDCSTWLMVGGTLPVLLAVLVDSALSLIRLEVGLDLIALISIGGALALGEHLVAAVIGLMLSGGRALEGYAEARARRDLSALLRRVPRTVNRYRDAVLTEVPLEEVAPGDRLLVRGGEAVPVDGTTCNTMVLDESALTGEPTPVTRAAGVRIRSGAINAGAPADMVASTDAAGSSFAAIVRLVTAAQETKAPAARLADQGALVFTPLVLGIAGAAWAWSADATRGIPRAHKVRLGAKGRRPVAGSVCLMRR